MTVDNEYLLKICFLSSSSELKTQFIRSFATNKFDRDDHPTLGVDITTLKIDVDENQVKLILVDTASQEFFGKLRPSYYRGASAATILFDKSDSRSFKDVPTWLKEFQTYIQPQVPVALVGLITSSQEPSEGSSKEISFEEGQALASQLNIAYFESSPADRQKVYKILSHLARQVIKAN